MPSSEASTWDLIVVGAGSAGAAFAARRAERGDRVLLLEAGPDYRSDELHAAFRSPNPMQGLIRPEVMAPFVYTELESSRTAAQEPSLYWRGRGLGGSSVINGQIAIRPPMEDFEDWAAAGCTGWAPADVLPYFNKLESDELYGSEDYHGDSGPIPVYRTPKDEWGIVDKALVDAALDYGFPWHDDINAPGAIGVSPYPINSRNQERVNTNDGYLEPLRENKNLVIRGESTVDRVLFDGTTAIGVSIVAGEGDERIEEFGTQIVISAGAVHSPGILIRSGIGPADTLGELGVEPIAVLPVGENFQDHAAIAAGFFHADVPGRPGPDSRHTNTAVRYDSGDPDGLPKDMMIVGMNNDVLAMEFSPADPTHGGICVWLNASYSRGRVTVTSTDPRVQPKIAENMLDDERDLRRLRAGVRLLVELLQHESVTSIARDTLDAENPELYAAVRSGDDAVLDAYILANAADTQHGTSTCRMGGADEPNAVVDPDLRVRGVQNLHVVDASIFPTCPRSNTHLISVMVGELAADRLDLNGAQR